MEIALAPNYIIYENGEIYSKDRVIMRSNSRKHTLKSQLIIPYLDINGYLRIALRVNKRGTNYTVHRLLAIAFIPNPNNLPCVNHIDKNRLNNSIENLEWIEIN
tara:strand:- start:118 stop:429 length:312 start_codon:yes stop_codon:yes gene_type:complete